MPITATVGTFNTGRDITIVLVGPYGRVDIPNIVSFDAKQETAAVKVDRLDGIQMPAELPKGWTGSIEFDRGDSAVDDFIAQIEAGWLGSGAYGLGTLYEYISESDGSQSTYQFDNVALKLADAGSWKPDAAVRVKLEFMANRRQRV